MDPISIIGGVLGILITLYKAFWGPSGETLKTEVVEVSGTPLGPRIAERMRVLADANRSR